MNNMILAMKLGVMEHSLINLYNGKVDIGISSKIGVIPHALQEFVNGKANIQMGMKLGLMSNDLQTMLNEIGKKGAIGLIIGMLLQENRR